MSKLLSFLLSTGATGLMKSNTCPPETNNASWYGCVKQRGNETQITGANILMVFIFSPTAPTSPLKIRICEFQLLSCVCSVCLITPCALSACVHLVWLWALALWTLCVRHPIDFSAFYFLVPVARGPCRGHSTQLAGPVFTAIISQSTRMKHIYLCSGSHHHANRGCLLNLWNATDPH